MGIETALSVTLSILGGKYAGKSHFEGNQWPG